MRYIKNYNDHYNQLNELLTHKSDDDLEGKHFILYKKDLWIFTEDEWEEKEIYEKINNIIGEDLMEEDFYDSKRIIEQEHPYILIGEIEDGYIILNGSDNYRHSNTSVDVKKLKKEIDLPIKISYRKGAHMDDEGDFDLSQLEDFKTAYYYHGTSVSYLEEISKTGIRPMDKNTNFDKIHHIDKIFFASNIEKALFHANKAALNTQSFPIILKFKIPDVDKVVIDFDLSMDFYGEDTETNRELGYDDISKKLNSFIKNKTIIEDSDKVNIMGKMGVFGYKGRIPASSIEDVYIDKHTLSYNPYMVDDMFDTELEYESDVWSEFDDVGNWSEMSVKETLEYIDNLLDSIHEEEEEEEEEWD